MPTKFKLKNNLSVLLIESHKSPVISAQMWVRTGSADEKKGQEGLSHFIEHLVFKGTKKFDVGEIASRVETSGGELNAFTSFDQTVFYVTISKEFSNVALEVISEMMGHPSFVKEEIDNEREVVLEEIKRSNDSLGRQASRLLFETNFKEHPYGLPVLGRESVIKKSSRKKIKDYYESRYVPQNMQLVVAGDFDAKEMKKDIKKYFEDIEDYKLKKVKRIKEKPQKETRIKVKKTQFKESVFHFSWKIPGVLHEDIAALDVLALILGQGESSRLTQRLRVQKPVVNSVGCGTFTPKDYGLFDISVNFNFNNMDEILEVLHEELGMILADPPSQEEMEKAIRIFESDEVYSVETVDGIARKAGMLEDLTGDYKFFKKYLSRISALRASDIQRVARKYLKASNLTIVLATPGDEKEARKKIRKWKSSFEESLKTYKKRKIEPTKKIKLKKLNVSFGGKTEGKVEIIKDQLSNGARLIYRRDTQAPVVAVKSAFIGGLRIEQENEVGITELMSRTWCSGSRDYSEIEIQHKIETIAGSLSAFGGRNTAGLSIQCLSPFQKDASEIYSSVMEAPLFDEGILNRERHMIGEQVRARQDSPAFLCSLDFLKQIFTTHPYARDPLGSLEDLNKITSEDLKKHYDRMIYSTNGTIVLTGDVDVDLWKEKLESAIQSSKNASLKKSIPVPALDKNKYSYQESEKEQSHIIYGFQALSLDDPDRYVMQIIQSILAGQGGRLFIELRDKASLAYTVAPMRLEGLDGGYFGAYIGCSPEKGETAIKMMKAEFDKLCQEDISDKELDRAKRFLIGRHDIDLQRTSSINTSILFNEVYGIPGEEIYHFSDSIKSVSKEKVRELSQKVFGGNHVISAIGPKKPF